MEARSVLTAPALSQGRHVREVAGKDKRAFGRDKPGLGTVGPDITNRLEPAAIIKRACLQ